MNEIHLVRIYYGLFILEVKQIQYFLLELILASYRKKRNKFCFVCQKVRNKVFLFLTVMI